MKRIKMKVLKLTKPSKLFKYSNFLVPRQVSNFCTRPAEKIPYVYCTLCLTRRPFEAGKHKKESFLVIYAFQFITIQTKMEVNFLV